MEKIKHSVFTDEEAQAAKSRLSLMKVGAVTSVVCALALSFYLSSLGSYYKHIAFTLMLSCILLMIFYHRSVPHHSDYERLPGIEHQEIVEMLSILLDQKKVFEQALTDGKSLRWRDYQYLYSVYRPIKDKLDKEDALVSISQPKAPH